MSDIPSWAVPGAKVVCVDEAPHLENFRHPYCLHSDSLPVRGVVYIVGPFPPRDPLGWPRIVIEGLPNRVNSRGLDWGWDVSRFRPLVTRTQEQDVAQFQKLLTRQLEPSRQ